MYDYLVKYNVHSCFRRESRVAESLLPGLRQLVRPLAERGGELEAARRHPGEAAVPHRDAQLPLLAAVRHAPQSPQTVGGEEDG